MLKKLKEILFGAPAPAAPVVEAPYKVEAPVVETPAKPARKPRAPKAAKKPAAPKKAK
jgi:hypothetical protein